MRRVMVTGGAGFIGSNFIRYWLQKYPEDRIVNLDSLTYAARHAYLEEFLTENNFQSRYTLDICDIANRGMVEHSFATHRPDLIIHFAAESHVCNSIKGPEVFFKTNVMGTFNLLEEARKYWGTTQNRFHHVSTDEVFGELRREDPAFDEKTNLAPRSPYAASKAASDLMCQSYAETYGMNITISNCSNNYGPNQHFEKLIPKAISKMILGEPVTVYGTGEQRRDWLHVLDHCYAIDTIIHRSPKNNRYCVGAETELSNLQVIQVVKRCLERLKNAPVEISIQHTNDRPTDDRRYAINNSKILSLGWSPVVPFEIGLQSTVSWYSDILSKKAAESAQGNQG